MKVRSNTLLSFPLVYLWTLVICAIHVFPISLNAVHGGSQCHLASFLSLRVGYRERLNACPVFCGSAAFSHLFILPVLEVTCSYYFNSREGERTCLGGLIFRLKPLAPLLFTLLSQYPTWPQLSHASMRRMRGESVFGGRLCSRSEIRSSSLKFTRWVE
jgi:hypothetical protein